jgi:hypothetical protein
MRTSKLIGHELDDFSAGEKIALEKNAALSEEGIDAEYHRLHLVKRQ